MGKPSAPQPPDPTKTAQAQTASNVDTARASAQLAAVNQNSPYGTVSYTQTPSNVNVGGANIPSYTQNVTLSPEQQSLYNKTTGIEGQALDTGAAGLAGASKVLSTPFGIPAGVPSLPLSASDFATQGQQAQDAAMQRFNQDWTRQQADTRSNEVNEGILPGSEQYTYNEDMLNRARNDALAQAIGVGNQQQNTLFQQAGQARQQALGEAQLMRNQPINELTALLGTSQIQTPSGAPNFGVSVAPTNVAGITNAGYQNQLAQYQAKLAASPWNAIGNIASAGAKAYFGT